MANQSPYYGIPPTNLNANTYIGTPIGWEDPLSQNPQYFSNANIKRLRELVEHVNEDEAERILNTLLREATKEGTDLVLSESVINAIALMVTDSCAGIPTTSDNPHMSMKPITSGMHIKTNLLLDGGDLIMTSSGGTRVIISASDNGTLSYRRG